MLISTAWVLCSRIKYSSLWKTEKESEKNNLFCNSSDGGMADNRWYQQQRRC